MKKIFIYSLIIFFIFTPIVYAIQGEIIGINEKENTILLKKENNSWFDKLKRFFGLDKAPFFEVYEVLINNPSVSQIDRNKLFNLFKEKTTLENLKPGDNIEIKDESSLHILKKESPEEIVCSKKYEPVCGKNNAVYLNECVALKNRVEIACYKECPCSGSKDEESFPIQIFDQVNFGLKTEKEDYFLLTSHQEYFQYIKDIIDPRLEKDYLTNNKVTLDENQNLKEYIEGSFKIDFSKNNILVIQPGTSYSHMSDILIHSIQKVDKTLFINYSVTMSKQCTSEDKEYYPAILIVVPKDHDIKYSKKINIIDCPFKLNYTCSKDSDCIKVGQNNNVCISKKTYDLDMFAEIENKEEYINKLLGENSNIFKDFAHSLLKYETMPCSCVNSKCEFVRYENVYEEENLCVLTSDCDNLEISNCPANHFCFYSCIKGKCEVIIEPISDKSLNQMSDLEIEQFKKEIEKQENSNYHPGKCFTDKDCIGYTSDSPKPPCPETASFCGYVCLDNQCIYQVVANEAKKESTTTNTTVTTKKEAVKEIFHPPYNPLCVDVKHKVDCLQDLDCERMFNKQNRQSNSICKWYCVDYSSVQNGTWCIYAGREKGTTTTTTTKLKKIENIDEKTGLLIKPNVSDSFCGQFSNNLDRYCTSDFECTNMNILLPETCIWKCINNYCISTDKDTTTTTISNQMMDPSEYETIDIPEGYNINSAEALKYNIHVEGYYNVEETTTTTTKYTPPTVPTTTIQESNFPEQYNPFFNFNSLKDYLLTNILKIFK